MGVWDSDFILRPDSVTGLQRRTGSYINEFKANLQERLVLEHEVETSDPVPQTKHGMHREGSGRAYVTASGAPDPTTRPTGGGITAQPLDADDTGRLLIKEKRDLYFWDGSLGTPAWVKLDVSLLGSIVIWPSDVIPNNWLLCNGALISKTTYADLWALLGDQFGTSTSSDFYLPNLQGIQVMGKGTQDINTRTKGYAEAIGTKKEDRIQTLNGKIRFRSIFEEYATGLDPTGIFKDGASEGGNVRAQRSVSWSGNTKTIIIDLDNDSVRHGDFGHPSVMLMNFIIKAI